MTDIQITHPLEHKEMGFKPVGGGGGGTRTINSGFTLQHNFGCDHADAGLPHSPSAKMGNNKK